MRHSLLAGTALIAIAHPISAQTIIDTDRTTPVATSTAANGQPSDVTIDEDGSITLTSGTAVTVDSNNDVTNDGDIKVTNASGANGILVTGPRTADIVNTGSITIDETYSPTDDDNDGDLDGPFALGNNRAAIRIDGPLTGKLQHSGAIVVEGNQSAGILVNGAITGNVVHDGTTSVVGDQSVGVRLDDVSGDVRLAGKITVRGEGSTGAVLAGDIGGALVVQSEIGVTGYRSVPAPTDPSRLDADDLLQGGSALVIEGNVAGGIIFAVAPANTNPNSDDDDADGIKDSEEGNAAIVSYGSAPAVVIGAETQDIAIGATEGTASEFGIILDGSVRGSGLYSGVDATAMQIGGRGGNVTIENGMLVRGTIAGTARNSDATGLEVAAGTTLPELRNSGTISAEITGTTEGSATALVVRDGASLPTVRNSGAIKATTLEDGTAYAIFDEGGTVTLIENSGAITATGAEADSGRNIAIDLSANTTGATIRQSQVATGVTPPTITGDIRLGSGDDLLDLRDGVVRGEVTFGDGIDRMTLSGDAVFQGTAVFGGQADELVLTSSSIFLGTADFGGGAGSLDLDNAAIFSGSLINAQNVAVNLTDGVLSLDGQSTIASLDVGEGGIIAATVSGAGGTAITVTGEANFADGAKIRVQLSDISNAEGSFTVLSAGTLTGAADLDADSALVPFLFEASLAVEGNSINVEVARKATEDLGLNTAESIAFDQLYLALEEDEDLAGLFLAIADEDVFQAYVAQTLPDHAGGTFEGINLGLRTFDRHLLDPDSPFDSEGKLRIMADFATWNSEKDREESAALDLSGLGFRGGVEYLTGIGAFGVTASWIWNKHKAPVSNDVISDAYEVGAHWRGHFGPVTAFARGGYGKGDHSGTRTFAGGSGDDAFSYTIARDWSSDFISASGGISIEGGGQFFFFRPSLVLDYLRLSEDGHTETGGGDALTLTIEDRTSKELAVNGGLTVGVDMFGMRARDEGWLRVEAEAGWRELLTSDLGTTIARYGEGEQFELTADPRDSGWFARLRGMGGDGSYRIVGEAGLEEQFGNVGYSLRASLRFNW